MFKMQAQMDLNFFAVFSISKTFPTPVLYIPNFCFAIYYKTKKW